MALCGSCPAVLPILQIDRDISLVRRDLRNREPIDQLSAESWQTAWDKHPDLRRRESTLFRERGIAQLLRA
jgi:hypothetical protein